MRDFARIAAGISHSVADQLAAEGFAVVDGLLGEDWASALLREMQSLVDSGLMREHKFQFAQAQLRKPHIYEADMHDTALRDDPRRRTPEIDTFFQRQPLANTLNERLPQLRLTPEATRATLKFQFNAGGGGCFPCHYDNAGKPSKRQVTCLFYFNSGWADGDGGELELLPFLKPAVRIPPRFDRVVLFLSDRVLHRVLPANKARYCFTVWIDGDAVNDPASVGLSAAHLKLDEASIASLQASPRQRAVSRAVYAEEYDASLRECMAGGEGATEMLAAHVEHVAQQMLHPQLEPFITGLRKLKPSASATWVWKTGSESSDAVSTAGQCGGAVLMASCSSGDSDMADFVNAFESDSEDGELPISVGSPSHSCDSQGIASDPFAPIPVETYSEQATEGVAQPSSSVEPVSSAATPSDTEWEALRISFRRSDPPGQVAMAFRSVPRWHLIEVQEALWSHVLSERMTSGAGSREYVTKVLKAVVDMCDRDRHEVAENLLDKLIALQAHTVDNRGAEEFAVLVEAEAAATEPREGSSSSGETVGRSAGE